VKASIVLETYRDGVTVADVARMHGISAPQVHAWRRAAREGLLPMPVDDMLGRVPVVVSGGKNSSGSGEGGRDGAIELDVAGVRIDVPARFDPDHLGRVIAAIRAVS
jgi:transposase